MNNNFDDFQGFEYLIPGITLDSTQHKPILKTLPISMKPTLPDDEYSCRNAEVEDALNNLY